MADHKHGSMDIEEQERTFENFLRITKNAVIAIIVALILLAIFNG